MKSGTNIRLTMLSIFTIVLFAGVLLFAYLEPRVKQNQLHSDLMFLDNVTRTCIKQYYELNQEYPESLSQIEKNILENSHDGTPPKDSKYRELLSNFQVFSDKTKLVLSWQIKKKDAIYAYETVFEKGQSISTSTQIKQNRVKKRVQEHLIVPDDISIH